MNCVGMQQIRFANTGLFIGLWDFTFIDTSLRFITMKLREQCASPRPDPLQTKRAIQSVCVAFDLASATTLTSLVCLWTHFLRRNGTYRRLWRGTGSSRSCRGTSLLRPPSSNTTSKLGIFDWIDMYLGPLSCIWRTPCMYQFEIQWHRAQAVQRVKYERSTMNLQELKENATLCFTTGFDSCMSFVHTTRMCASYLLWLLDWLQVHVPKVCLCLAYAEHHNLWTARAWCAEELLYMVSCTCLKDRQQQIIFNANCVAYLA